MRRHCSLGLELLEDRALPALFGVPWADARHLSLSFAPDGTVIAGHSSNLFQTLDSQLPGVWQQQILRAVQTWVNNANLSVGLVADGGQPFGTPGLTQHDPRFGDIRIGAQPMSPEVFAIGVPHDPYFSGTWAGDILLNSNYDFSQTQCRLFGVMLHEIGHVLGIPETQDPMSAVGPNVRDWLSECDVRALQALYGPRLPDANEGARGNDTLRTAKRFAYPDGPFDGTTPLVAYGEIKTDSDVDYFSLRTPSYTGPMTFRLQSTGLSLLSPQLKVYDASGNLLDAVKSVDPAGDTVRITLDHVAANKTYYVRVEAARPGIFGSGRYGLAISFDSTLQYDNTRIDQVLRGPFDTRSTDEIDEIFRHPEMALFVVDHEDHDRFGKALVLQTTTGYGANQHYEFVDHVEADKQAYFLLHAPVGNSPITLTVVVNALSVNGVAARAQVFDAQRNEVATAVLVNDGAAYTIQAAGLRPGVDYYLKLTLPGTQKQSGNYALVADFRLPAEVSRQFAGGTLAPGGQQRATLYVAQAQLFQFALSAVATKAPAAAAVSMTIRDAGGAIVFALTTPAGEAVSGNSVLLTPGEYSVIFTGTGYAGNFDFRLSGASLTDPIGPAINDPTLTPTYTLPQDPFYFYYPNGTVTLDPFYWLLYVV